MDLRLRLTTGSWSTFNQPIYAKIRQVFTQLSGAKSPPKRHSAEAASCSEVKVWDGGVLLLLGVQTAV